MFANNNEDSSVRRGWKMDLIENSRSAQSSSVFIIERFYCDCVFGHESHQFTRCRATRAIAPHQLLSISPHPNRPLLSPSSLNQGL